MAAAITLMDDIERINSDRGARAEINGLLRRLGVWVGLSFAEGIKGKERKTRKLAGGIMTLGDAPLPVRLYGRDNAEDPESGARDADRWCDPDCTTTRGEVIDLNKPISEGGHSEPSPDACDQAGSGPGTGERSAHLDNCRREGGSFTNVHRGDWIRTSDLCVPNAAL